MKKNLLLLLILVVLGGGIYFIYQKNAMSSISDDPMTDFAIADTAAITKVFIVDQKGTTALLERVPGQLLWNINGKYPARKDAVDLILKTFCNVRVRGNVPVKKRENVMKLLATSAKKVEIYMGGDEPAKIYYIGPATEDHTGTYMLLETPENGRSEEPYITHMEGFTGFLTPRFFADEMDWRYTGIFNYPQLDFTDVKMIDHMQASNSFEVKYTGGNKIEVYGGYNPATNTFGALAGNIDSLHIKDFLLGFKKCHFEGYRTDLSPRGLDSLQHMPPAFTIEVTEASGKINKVDLFLKLATKQALDENGNVMIWDQDYFYGRDIHGEIGFAQTFNFAPLVQPLTAYQLKK